MPKCWYIIYTLAGGEVHHKLKIYHLEQPYAHHLVLIGCDAWQKLVASIFNVQLWIFERGHLKHNYSFLSK